MVELEALAIYYGIKQYHLYLSGMPEFEVIANHQRLKKIFNLSDLLEIDRENLMKVNERRYQQKSTQ